MDYTVPKHAFDFKGCNNYYEQHIEDAAKDFARRFERQFSIRF